MSDSKTILFLQGHPSTFAGAVAKEIARRGGRVLRINLCAGDALFWRGSNAISYRGRLQDWPQFLRDFIRREGVSDIVYYADRLPYHRVAAAVAREFGIRTATYEFGYLRPDWITLEHGGMSAWSHFPRAAEKIRDIAGNVPEPDLAERYPYSFLDEAFCEVTYNLATFLGWPLYPHYEADKYYHPVLDYLSYIPRLATSGRDDRRARGTIAMLCENAVPFFVCPMQMQNDYQLRANSHYRHQSEMLEEVIASFAQHAAADAHLVLKVHPLDNGRERWDGIVDALSQAAGVSQRVHLVRGGDLRTLLTAAQGVVLVNSTVGVHALRHGRPVKVLGIAVYDIAGLTHQGDLDGFWRAPTAPDAELCADFVKAMAATIHVKGNFFTKAGRAAAVPAMAERLLAGTVNQPGALEAQPPRLARAAALGIPFNLHEAVVAAGLAPLAQDGEAVVGAEGEGGAGAGGLAASNVMRLPPRASRRAPG